MKAKELMIGDWVTFNAETPKMCKVVSIDTDTDNGNYIKQSLTDIRYTEDCFEPIPLTAEILEKNGFKGEGYAILNIDESSWLEYYYYERRLRKKWRGVDEWQNHAHVTDITFQCHCSYVHELQHALRLCGIEKEIKL